MKSPIQFASVDALLDAFDAEAARAVTPTESGCFLKNRQDSGQIAWCLSWPNMPLSPAKHMLPANRSLRAHFSNWLTLAGYGAAGRFVFSRVSQIVFTVSPADWRYLDIHIAHRDATAFIARRVEHQRVAQVLRSGLDTCIEYLRIRIERNALPWALRSHLPWPLTAEPEYDLSAIWGDEPAADSARSGCVPPKQPDGQRRAYIKSHSQPKHIVKQLDPGALRLVPVKAWRASNQALYQQFRNWLSLSGYRENAVYLYGLAVRLFFSRITKDWREIDLQSDFAAVSDWLVAQYASAPTRQTYTKGLQKLAEYLRRRHGQIQGRASIRKPELAPDTPALAVQIATPGVYKHPRFLARTPLPEAIERSLHAYFAHCRRNWPQDRVAEIGTDWWSHTTRAIRLINDAALKDGHGTVILSASDLTARAWLAYVDTRLAAGISPVTLNSELSALKGWLFWLSDNDEVVDPRMLRLRSMREPRRVPKDLPTGDLLRLQQAIELTSLSLIPGERWRASMDMAWFLLMLHSGLRTGEVRRLMPADIDWERRRVSIEASKHLVSRIVPFSEATAAALNNWITLRGEGELQPATVFLDRNLPLSKTYCYSRLQTYAGRAGISKVHPHQLRHSCATLLLNAGMPIAQVQTLLGHALIDTTRGYARSYDGTVAADYTRAMLSVERDLGVASAGEPLDPAQVTALLDSLAALGPLNQQQKDVVARVRAVNTKLG